ncbi:MAG: hypothetical protein IPK69_09280 [Phycisphaerales bacterium]|nr:MAG: hypothetical protein IPK69_09280 [Phycisphaerales bacterium]
MIRQIGVWLGVLVLATLVWVFAEAETLRTREVTIDLTFRSDPQNGRVIDVANSRPAGTDGQVVSATIKLAGAANAVDQAERELRSGLKFDPSSPGMPGESGAIDVDLKQLIRLHPTLRVGSGSGATVQAVEPSIVRIDRGTLVAVEVPVRVELERGEAEGAPVVTPARVTLRVPTELASSIGEQTPCTAQLSERELSRLVPGRQEKIEGVSLTMPEGLLGHRHAYVEPRTVSVQLTLRDQTQSVMLQSVPVHIQLAATEQSRWDITLAQGDQFLKDVRVSGPSDLIKQIQDKTLPVVAILQLSFQELEGGKVTSKDVVFSNLPTGLRFEVADRTVSFTIARRNGSAAATTAP